MSSWTPLDARTGSPRNSETMCWLAASLLADQCSSTVDDTANTWNVGSAACSARVRGAKETSPRTWDQAAGQPLGLLAGVLAGAALHVTHAVGKRAVMVDERRQLLEPDRLQNPHTEVEVAHPQRRPLCTGHIRTCAGIDIGWRVRMVQQRMQVVVGQLG